MVTDICVRYLSKYHGLRQERENCFFSNFSYIQVTQKHKSKMKIQVAIARKILVAVWHMLSKQEDFIDLYLKRLEEQRLMEGKIRQLESKMA